MFRSVITLANSIIGVSILAMPFCFKQCGIVLATFLLLLSGVVVKVTSHLLLKGAILARRRNYELLAYEAFGSGGKLAIEVCMIGFMMGTCIAFFVVIGDLAPPIIANILRVDSTPNLRLVILIGLGVFVTLPLSLLRNVESLAGICTASIGFYLMVLLHIVVGSWPSLIDGSWTSVVNFWRPAGVFQCLPIFFMALSCQAQVFEVYDALSEPSLHTMNEVVKGAVNLCTGCYLAVGIFGYIAFCTSTEVGGNILTSFPHSFSTEVIKLGFVLSVAVSFPLVVFPCRSSLYSLMFKKGGSNISSDLTTNYIPPNLFNIITVMVIGVTLVLGVLIPDIEFVLGMVGSTIGAAVCTVFPSLMFIKLTSKNTTERLAAQLVLVCSIVIMIMGTYVNLHEANRGPEKPYQNSLEDQKLANMHELPPINALDPLKDKDPRQNLNEMPKVPPLLEDKHEEKKPVVVQEPKEKRKEPVEPKPPADEDEQKLNSSEVTKKVIHEPEKVDTVPGKNDTKSSNLDKDEREKKAEKLIEELEKQKEEQKEIIAEQKELLQQLKEHVAEENKNQSQNTTKVQGNKHEAEDNPVNGQPQLQGREGGSRQDLELEYKPRPRGDDIQLNVNAVPNRDLFPQIPEQHLQQQQQQLEQQQQQLQQQHQGQQPQMQQQQEKIQLGQDRAPPQPRLQDQDQHHQVPESAEHNSLHAQSQELHISENNENGQEGVSNKGLEMNNPHARLEEQSEQLQYQPNLPGNGKLASNEKVPGRDLKGASEIENIHFEAY